MSGRTQAALYAEIDLELSWSEHDLPQVERTKHVHALHPYLGKFIPQLVEAFLRRYFKPSDCIYDPFVGSGSTIIAAETTARVAYAIEIDPAYVEISLTRWQKFTGRKAVLGETKETFDQVTLNRNGGKRDEKR